MKGLIVLLAIISSFTLHARADVNDSWRSLSRNSRVIYRMPQIVFGNYYLRANRTCVAGDQLRSLKTVKECTRWNNGNRDSCIRYRDFFVYKDLESTSRQCTRYESRGDNHDVCVRYEDVTVTIPTEYQVPVYRRMSGGRDGDDFDRSSRRRPLFTKTFEVPSC